MATTPPVPVTPAIPGMGAVTEQDVVINGDTYTAITTYTVQRQTTIPTHKTEMGYQIADHIFDENTQIDLTLKLFKDLNEHTKIQALYDKKTTLSIYSELGSYDNVVIGNLKLDRGDTLNTVIGTLSLKQIRIGNAVQVSTTLPASVSDANLPGSGSAKAPGTATVNNPATVDGTALPKVQASSWYDQGSTLMGWGKSS